MSVEAGIVDANILADAVNGDAPQHAVSRALLETARDPAVSLYVTSQILCEFYSVVTNPRRVAAASSPAAALGIISALLAHPGMRVLPIPADVVGEWMELVRRRPVTGANVFDLQIVATMLANRVHRIYTFNVGDFDVFPEITVVRP